MSRMKQTIRTTNANTIKGSRMTGTSLGMGRDPRNYPSRSPKITPKFNTPEKIRNNNQMQGSGKKFNTLKKQT